MRSVVCERCQEAIVRVWDDDHWVCPLRGWPVGPLGDCPPPDSGATEPFLD